MKTILCHCVLLNIAYANCPVAPIKYASQVFTNVGIIKYDSSF